MVTVLIICQGGANLITPHQISRIIRYKTLRNVFFLSFIQYCITCMKKTLKRRKNNNMCPPGNRPWSSGSMIYHTNHYTKRSDRLRFEITVHIEQTIRLSAIFVCPNKVKAWKLCTLFDFTRSTNFYLILRRWSLDISDTF